MDRLIATNSVPLASADTAPVSGTPQYATAGNPAAGVPATQWPAYQYNAIQEELMNAIESDGTAGDRNDNTQLKAKLEGRRLGPPIIFSSSGTYTPSPGARLIRVQAVGGGGAGAGSAATDSGNLTACSGGGSGAYVDAWFFASSLGTSVAIAVGAAGAPGDGSGGQGGTTTFGSYISCQGGFGGAANSIPNNTNGYAGQGTGGQSASVSGAIEYLARNGQSGTNGMVLNGGQTIPGIGGWSPLGAGGPNAAPGRPTAASGYGAGGGGSGVGTSSPAVLGGAATGGVVIVEEFS